MIIDRGCSPESPGIGDIEYVKDLLTGEVATTTFRCSKFGVGHHPNSKIGWVCIFVTFVSLSETFIFYCRESKLLLFYNSLE